MHEGDSAILRMMRVIAAIGRDLGPKIAQRRSGTLQAMINIGRIRGGSNTNVVPDFCEIEVDRRLVPEETVEGALAELEKVALAAGEPAGTVEIERITGTRGFRGSETGPCVRAFGEAIADLRFVFATTARSREMAKAVRGPDEAVATLRSFAASGQGTGVLFGRERTGLTNEEVSLANEILTLPIDPAHASLNIAQAVLIVAYEWRRSGLGGAPGLPFGEEKREPAARVEIIRLFEHLEGALDDAGFFRPVERREHMVSSIRALLQRANLSEQEVRTLRGVVAALEGRPTRPHRSRDGGMSTERERDD